MSNHFKTFGDVEAAINGNEAQFRIEGYGYNEDQLSRLADDIRSAQCWLRDIRRRQAENETPELPMQ